ncbi:MAG: serine/threonine protein kinase, partial [Verrucomicrobiae bacterium]|nr:serine/threonine protein kinase [Verrucomicrobiae bacterium]
MNSLEGQTFAGFAIIRKLGEGGMGAVYLARQAVLNRPVALKLMAESLSKDPEFVARFQREAATAANLAHPNIVQVYQAGEQDGVHFIAMEYVEGETLRDHIERQGRLEPTEAIAVPVHIAQALQYAWNKTKLIHRDIKPDNIFLSTSGEVKLGDLGLAKRADISTELTRSGVMMGSPHYISPEQAKAKKDVDLRADIYSLGCTLFHMLTGRTPYEGEDALAIMNQHVNGPPTGIFNVWPECPVALGRLVGKMTAKQRHERHQSYEELLEELMAVHEKLKQSSVPAAVSPPVPSQAGPA